MVCLAGRPAAVSQKDHRVTSLDHRTRPTFMQRLPNRLSCLRLLLAPVFMAVFLFRSPEARILALAIALVVEITDLMDGIIARRYHAITAFGKLVDPLADSVSRFTIFLSFLMEPFVQQARWPVFFVLVLFLRDIAVAYVRTCAATQGRVLAARLSGKLKAVVQGAGIFVYLIARTAACWVPGLEDRLPWVFYSAMVPLTLVTLWSLWDYIAGNWDAVRALLELEPRCAAAPGEDSGAKS